MDSRRHNFTHTPVHTKKKRLFYSAVFFLILWILLALGIGALFAFENKYESRAYPGVHLGPHNLGGMNQLEVAGIISHFLEEIEQNGIRFTYKQGETVLYPNVFAPDDLDLTYELYAIDTEKTINEIFRVGRDRSFRENFITKLGLLTNPQVIQLSIISHPEFIQEALRDNFLEYDLPAKNAELVIDRTLTITIIPEESGIVPNYPHAIQILEQQLPRMITSDIIIPAKRDIPTITAHELAAKRERIESLFENRPSLTITHQDYWWRINKNIYKDWLDTRGEALIFNEEFITHLEENISPEVETPVQEARFQLTDRTNLKVTEFKPSRDGLDVNEAATLSSVNSTFFKINATATPTTLVTRVIAPKYNTESLNDLGIKEIIGRGESDFSRSPQNRRHNIKIGADSLNGVLIPPGEEFSLIHALGAIDGESGYLEELVIKGNRTIPEYGGGLCQIGTTLFRAVLDTGLPVTERRNHSYRVRYYEPAGTDCTIYSPNPDCKFINDTEHHILIQTEMTPDDKMVFEFWGTKDGREVVQTEPIIYNITDPPPTKYIETTDLPVGEINCTERAHNGADAKFDYTVRYANGSTTERTFYSHYRPWQEVCLIGVEPE